MATTKRKLPVLQSAPEEETRSPWQWVGFGTVMTFTAWLPLAYVGAAVAARVEPRPGGDAGTPAASIAGLLLAMIVPLVVAAAGGGYLVGRFGKPAGVREALLSGVVTGLAAVVITALSAPFSPVFLLVIVIATAASWGGGALGVRHRVV